MNDERDLQDWFKSSVEELPPQPFTLVVLERVQRRERRVRLQRYTAWLLVSFSFCLLLPELVVLLNRLAALPLVVVDVGGEHWPLLVIVAVGVGYWLHVRSMGLVRRA